MPTPTETPFKVFYSWQSDLPSAVNLKLIRNALNQAAGLINTERGLNLHVVIDEATREVPGSPDIADSIFAKIKQADVFVCDLTKVTELRNEAGEIRKYCNSNAALELGYAVRVLGWNRIIIVFNEAYGVVPDDLPFDARGHRTSTFRCVAELNGTGRPTPECQAQISNSTGNLRATLVEALKLISRDNPKRPHELEAKSPQEIRRERDVEQLQGVFNFIHLKMLDHFIDRLGYSRIPEIGLSFFEGLDRVVTSGSFHIYDEVLLRLVTDFHTKWKDCFRYLSEMDAIPNHTEFYFHMPMDIAKSQEQADHCRDTGRSYGPLREALDALLRYVRVNYLEIDPNTCGYEAMKHYSATSKK
jgi:hypothetical protein